FDSNGFRREVRPRRRCPSDYLNCHATEHYLQQSNRLCGTRAECNDVSAAHSRDDRSRLLARFPRALGDMVDPDCPKTLPARAGRIARRGESSCIGLGERFGVGQYVLVYLPESGVLGWGWLWVVLALLLDLGVYSSPARRAARARKCIRFL